MVAVDGMPSEKAPSAFVEVPIVVPLAKTVTPGRPCPVERSVTRPEIVRSCADAWCHKQLSRKTNSREKCFILKGLVSWEIRRPHVAECDKSAAKLSHSYQILKNA